MLVNWSNEWIKVVDELNAAVIDDFDYENVHGSYSIR